MEIKVLESDFEKYSYEFGPKILRVIQSDRNEIVEWYTPDKLIFDHNHGRCKICGIEDLRRFSTFDLHYVGISKESDSLSRLIGKAHENRAKILSNETQYKPTARLTDELFLFLFKISELGVRTIDYLSFNDEKDSFIDQMFNGPTWSQKTLVIDAEKAFVKLLQTKYNRIKYKGYPRSSDGLSKHKLTRYSFSINELLTFKTTDNIMNGDIDLMTNFAGPDADLIAIQGDTVDFLTADYLKRNFRN